MAEINCLSSGQKGLLSSDLSGALSVVRFPSILDLLVPNIS